MQTKRSLLWALFVAIVMAAAILNPGPAWFGTAQAQTEVKLPCYYGVDYTMVVFRSGEDKKPDITLTPAFKRVECRESWDAQPTRYFLDGYPLAKWFNS